MKEVAVQNRISEFQIRFAAILEATSDIVGMADPDGRILYVNGGCRKTCGIRPDVDVSRMHIADFHPKWAARVIEKEAIPTAVSLGAWRGETAVLGPDGQEIPVSQVILSHKDENGTVQFLSTVARDAMPSGGKLTIGTANSDSIEFSEARGFSIQPGPYVMVSISDTGEGMDEVTQQRIFEPFFTTKELGKGMGLGLSTVYGIVKQSGGYILVSSARGKGSAFSIYLPRTEAVGTTIRKSTEIANPTGGSETVLLVEDEESVRALLCRILRLNKYTVLEAANGETAGQVCEEHRGPIHLMLTDVFMPGESGPDLVKRILGLHPRLKVLYMSGHSDHRVFNSAFFAADMPFLQKPFTPETLLRKVREVLDENTR